MAGGGGVLRGRIEGTIKREATKEGESGLKQDARKSLPHVRKGRRQQTAVTLLYLNSNQHRTTVKMYRRGPPVKITLPTSSRTSQMLVKQPSVPRAVTTRRYHLVSCGKRISGIVPEAAHHASRWFVLSVSTWTACENNSGINLGK